MNLHLITESKISTEKFTICFYARGSFGVFFNIEISCQDFFCKILIQLCNVINLSFCTKRSSSATVGGTSAHSREILSFPNRVIVVFSVFEIQFNGPNSASVSVSECLNNSLSSLISRLQPQNVCSTPLVTSVKPKYLFCLHKVFFFLLQFSWKNFGIVSQHSRTSVQHKFSVQEIEPSHSFSVNEAFTSSFHRLGYLKKKKNAHLEPPV